MLHHYFSKLSNKKYFFFIAILGLFANILSAYSTLGYFQQDEHYQILEFMHNLTFNTSPDKMVWEYQSQIRPWFQPFSYFLSLKLLSLFFNLNDPFFISFLIRLESCLFAFIGQCIFTLALYKIFNGNKIWKISTGIIFLFYIFPFLSARTSSENISSTFILLSFSTFIFSIKDKIFHISELKQNLSFHHYGLFLSGLFSGLAFEVRFQSAFFIIGFALWILFNSKRKFKFILTYFSAIGICISLGTLIDSYCYRKFVFSPWNYFDYNILKGVAANFGVSPFYYYINILFDFFAPPLGFFIILGIFISIIKFRKSILLWSFLSFVGFHSLIGHKEERFLFPIFILMVPILCQSILYLYQIIDDNMKYQKYLFALKSLKRIFNISFIVIFINSCLILFFTIYKVENISFGFLNTFAQRFKHHDIKALEFLDKNVETSEYYGFNKDIQCDDKTKDSKCDLYRYFYIKNQHNFILLNSNEEYIHLFKNKDKYYYNYLYLDKNNIDFVKTNFYKDHCKTVYLSRSIPIYENEFYLFQNSILKPILNLKHWYNRGYANIFIKCSN